jgi:BirA family biotin operon repressor/biotin-[acetyl-CoA-carboxylase] ligase
LEIYYFNTLPSTQAHLLAQIEKGLLTAPVAVWCEEQSAGLGSRGNRWSGGKGNFFASFALPLEMIPEDLPLGSASIYFSFIMKQTLKEFGGPMIFIWIKIKWVERSQKKSIKF